MDFVLESLSPDRRKRGQRLVDVRRSFAAAKKRALYWSGAPFFDPTKSLIKKGVHRNSHNDYHGAIAQVRACAEQIHRLTGRRPRPFDPRLRCKETGQGTLHL